MTIDRNYNIKDIKIVSICLLIMLITGVLTYFDHNISLDDKVKSFRNSEILVCYDTLIVTDSNWKISGTNLYNHNSAGYIEIKNCKIKK